MEHATTNNTVFLKKQSALIAPKLPRKGAGIMEMVFVLLIIITIIGGALALARGAMSQSTVAQEIQIITNLSAGVYKTRTRAGYTSDNIVDDLVNMGLLPANVANISGTLKNSWNGDISIQSTDANANFSITYNNVPKEECTQMLMGVKAGILNSVGSGNTSSKNINDVSPSDSSTLCPSTAGNTITWDTQILAES